MTERRPTFAQLQAWYLCRISEEEVAETKKIGAEVLRQHHQLQRCLSDGLRLLREVIGAGFKLDQQVPEDIILPIDFYFVGE